MVIFVTDEGRFWNHKNPVLERYARCVVVVCLNGKPVTDKYKCIVCQPDSTVGLGMTDYSIQSSKYKALEAVREELRSTYSYHDNLVFLTDAEPESLYPYLVLKEGGKHNKMHLWCMSPWSLEPRNRKAAFRELLHDISKVHSLHYVDGNELLEELDRRITMAEAISVCREWLNSMLPGALYEIETMLRWNKRYYYDRKLKRYIETKCSYEEILKMEPLTKKDVDNFSPAQKFRRLGFMVKQNHSDSAPSVKSVVEQLHPRVDGKKICDKLKRMRKAIADANGIEYETVNCPSVGSCAGTCQQCDMELKYLQEKLEEIKEEDRVYPQFNVERSDASISLYVGEKSVLFGDISTQRNTETVMMGVLKPDFQQKELKIPDFLQKAPKIPDFLRKEPNQDE